MKISEIFSLDKSQAELDFVDIDISTDTPLYIDPFFIGLRSDEWSHNARRTIQSFFQRVVDLVRDDNIEEAKELFQFLHEPNSTCLGISKEEPQGRGVGVEDTDNIFDRIIESQAIQTGLIRDLEDNILFVDHFGKDKLSDMTTNIIRKHLIRYTQSQCNLHDIELTESVSSEYFWDRGSLQWMNTYTDMLVIEGRKILLVPKATVSYCKDYTHTKYYNHFVLNFLQNEHVKMGSALVKHRKDGTPYVSKKDLKDHYPNSKEFLRGFTQRNPEVLEYFKENSDTRSLRNVELADIDLNELATYLYQKLENIKSGKEEAERYHSLIMGILELIFYPHLIYPEKEREIHQGRKRIDIVFDNAARNGIFNRLSENMNLPCQYIFVECKNYSTDPNNPELDQLAGRFSINRGKVGFLLCREFNNEQLFIQRCRDTYRDDRGLIIPITDQDIRRLLMNINEWDSTYLDKFMSDKIRNIAVN